MADTYDRDWLDRATYDTLRASDFELFVAAARKDPAAHVPTCPKWDVAALCDHLARVYQGRAHVIEHGSFLDRDAFEVRDEQADPLEWVQRWFDRLDQALRDRDDDEATITFVPGVASMRFWRRRMTLETLVHRTDAEIAVGAVSPMDDALSADGVDELLWFLSFDDADERAGHDEPADGSTGVNTVVALTDGTRTWRVALGGDGVTTPPAEAPADATVSGSAPALLLAVSGRDLAGIGVERFGVELPSVQGDPAVYEGLLTRLGGF
jgi:uncharacterized protein (TIGR03083 family)